MGINEAMQLVEKVMHQVIETDVPVLREASEHILSAGGKRVRPRLALLSYQAAGGKSLEAIAPVAAAVELVHTASVVHDDINDHGVLRRGRPSVNAIWGRTFALLTGDYLFTKVYELMAPHKELNPIMAEAAVRLVEGETLQAAAVKNNNYTRQVYYDIIARKTASLFEAGAHFGARLAQADEAIVNALRQFGFNVGMAFQIIDDILDLTADDTTLGKTSGIDLDQGRGYAAINSNGNGAVAVMEAVAAVDEADPMTKIKAKIMNGDAIAEGRRRAHELVDMAIACLDVLPQSPARDELADLAYMVVNRSY
jgi:geranylgeranyl pyrophosphate synthase